MANYSGEALLIDGDGTEYSAQVELSSRDWLRGAATGKQLIEWGGAAKVKKLGVVLIGHKYVVRLPDEREGDVIVLGEVVALTDGAAALELSGAGEPPFD